MDDLFDAMNPTSVAVEESKSEPEKTKTEEEPVQNVVESQEAHAVPDKIG